MATYPRAICKLTFECRVANGAARTGAQRLVDTVRMISMITWEGLALITRLKVVQADTTLSRIALGQFLFYIRYCTDR